MKKSFNKEVRMVKRQDGVKRIKKGMRIRREGWKGDACSEKMSQIVHICKWTYSLRCWFCTLRSMRKYPAADFIPWGQWGSTLIWEKACEGKKGDRGSKESEWKNLKRFLLCVNQRELLALKENGWNKLKYVSSAKQGKMENFKGYERMKRLLRQKEYVLEESL